MKLKTTFWLVFLVLGTTASAQNIFVSPTAAGADTGADCADAHSAAFFNNSANWGSGAGKIGAGQTVHLCGTFIGSPGSTMLSTQASGSAGKPITILFEPGASLSAPYWSSTGAVQINNSFIVVDGGTNGQIAATANGTRLSNQVNSDAIDIGQNGSPHDVEIKNLSIINLCVRLSGDASGSCTGAGVRLVGGGGNILVHDNTMHDLSTGVSLAITTTETGDQIYSNTIYNRDAGIIVCTCASGITITGMLIYDNDIGTAANWDNASDSFHHDGIHIFSSGGNGVLAGARIYSNYFHGDFGGHSTAGVFLEDNWSAILTFNNAFAITGGYATDGLIFIKGAGGNNAGGIYNNTITTSVSPGGPCIGIESSTGNLIKNNLTSGCGTAINVEDAASQTGIVINFNDHYRAGQWAWPSIYSVFTSWQSGTDQDTSSTILDPKLDANLHLQSGSGAIGLGENLSAVFTTDKDGNTRPAAGQWDAGAYVFGATNLLTPPTQLQAAVN